MQYPFEEGEHYFTIENHTIVESVWDAQSEELFDKNKMYFRTFTEAFYCYRFTRTDEMLHKLATLLGELKVDDDESNEKIIEFLSRYNYFSSTPKISLL